MRRGEEGQTVVFVAIFLVVLLAVLGLVIDLGNLYLTQRHLQTAADAAALAAAQDLPNSSANACNYSGSASGTATCTVDGTNVLLASTGDNYNSSFGNVQTTAAVECVSVGSAGTSCQTGSACNSQVGYGPAGNSNNLGCNAIKVTETTSVQPLFMQILGFGSQTVSASATAGIAGGTPHPLNVEMIDDSTASMQTADSCGGTPTDVPSSQSGNLTQEDCAKAGIRELLTQLYPCQPNLPSCGPAVSGTNIASPLDEVGMMVFPALTNSFATGNGVTQELNCSQDLDSGDVTYGSGANYQVVPFSSDFRLSDAATKDPLATLNSNSNLVRSVYWPGDGCPNGGYPIPGGSTTSITGGAAADTTSTTNRTPPALQVGGSTTATNSGITQGHSINTTNTASSGITHGNSTTVSTSALTIAGGPNSGSSSDRSTNTNTGTNIQVTRPGSSSTRAAGDFLLATITAQGSGITSSSNICPLTGTPGPWTLVNEKVSGTGATAVIQAVYSSTRTTNQAETYQFNFWGGACNSGGALTLAASAVVLRYSNVSGVDSANGVGANTGGPTPATLSGQAPNTGWTAGTTTYTNSSIGSATWSSTTSWASVSSGGQCTTLTACDTAVTSAGTVTGATFAFGTATAKKQVFTVTLLINHVAPTTGTPTCTIDARENACTTPISGSWNVNAGDKIELSVQLTGGTGTLISTASASATEATGTNTHYMSLASSCVNTAVTVCDDATAPAPGGSFASANLTFSNAVPTGDAVTVTLYKNDASSGLTCTIAAAQNTCTTPITGTLALATGDSLELLVTTTGTAAFPNPTTASSTASLLVGGTTLSAPSVTTAQPNEQVVRLFGTGATSFAAGSLPVTISSGSTSTGADDAPQAAAGTTGPESIASSTPDNWVAQSVALIPALPSSITLSTATSTLPSDYQGNTGDFLLVSVAVQGLGSGVVCAPANWNSLTPVSEGSGTTEVTHATFWTTLSTATSDTFTFYPSACGTGTPVPALASAVATTYNGVNVAAIATAATVNSTGNTSGQALTASQNATPGENYEVVNLFATTDSFNGSTPSFIEQSTTTSGAPDIGESAGSQQAAGNQAPQATASTGNSGTWTAQTVDLTPLLNSSITLSSATSTIPSDYQGDTGDFLLVSVAAQALGSAVICSPNDGTWNKLSSATSGSGATELTQATFWTTASTAATDTFTFYPTPSCTGTAVAAAASAVATTYNGVNVALTPTITAGGNSSGTTLTAVQNPTTVSDEAVVNLFATTDAFAAATPSFSTSAQTSPSSVWANVGESMAIQQTIGNQGTAATATTAHSATWTTESVDLVPLLSSTVTVTRPIGYVSGSGDLMLVSISVANLGSGSICAPNSTDWAPVPLSSTSPAKYTVTQGDLTQETFYTSTSADPTDTFTLYSRASCNGTPLGVGASAVAVYYTGVDTASPFDATSGYSSGTSATLNPSAITTSAGDELVGLYASDATNLALTGSTILASGNGLVPSSGATNAAPAAGSHAPSSATTVGNSVNWTTESIALRPLGSSGVIVTRPSNPAAGDFILVTVTTTGLNAGAGDNICAPNDGTWQELVPSTGGTGLITNGAISQATFYSARPTANAESYVFNFTSGACSGGGSPLTGNASAIAVRYAGVNPITPIDYDAVSDVPSYASNTGSSTTPTPKAVTPARAGDWVVALYGTGATNLTVTCTGTKNAGTYQGFVQASPAGTSSETGQCSNKSPNAATSFAPPTATTSSSPWITQTIALESASGGCGSNCEYGIEDPGGAGTNYALPIDAAQAKLQALASTRPTAQNVIILLSDGDATTNAPGGSNPCQAGITEAEKAEATGTWIFSIAYGANYDQSSSQTKSCKLDTSGPLSGLSAQCALILVAHNVVTDPTLGSDTNAESTLCNNPPNTFVPSDPSHKYFSQSIDSSLEQVFNEVGVALTTPRLISNDAT